MARLLVGFTAVESLLDVAPQRRGVDVVQQIQRADDAVELPQRPLRAVLAPVGAELFHDHALGRRLERRREQDALDVGLYREDQALPDATVRLDGPVPVVARRMVESAQPALHLTLDVAVARREAVTKLMQQGEVDVVGPLGVGGVHRRDDVGGVVEQDVENEVTLVLVGADDAR